MGETIRHGVDVYVNEHPRVCVAGLGAMHNAERIVEAVTPDLKPQCLANTPRNVIAENAKRRHVAFEIATANPKCRVPGSQGPIEGIDCACSSYACIEM